MKKGLAKFSGRTLYRVVCILFVLMSLSVWAVSGVYAKYVSSTAADASAGVALMGVKEFKISEHQVIDISEDFEKLTKYKYSTLYEFTNDIVDSKPYKAYSTVIPGLNIPKDPFVQLKIENSEVSFELYIVITESNWPKDKDGKRLIEYNVTSDWEPVPDNEGKSTDGIYKYKYVGNDYVSKEFGVVNGVFMAGKSYDFSTAPAPKMPSEFKNDEQDVEQSPDDNVQDGEESQDTQPQAIRILDNNLVRVNEYFDSDHGEIKFSLTFTAYLQQVIKLPPQEGTETEGD